MSLSFLPQIAIVYMLIFARLGAMLMLLPGLGESTISSRVRLSFALAVALLLYPMVSQAYGPMPTTLAGLAAAFALELVIGLSIGFTARLVLAALQIAGATIAMQMSLSFAEGLDPNQGQHSAILTSFLTLTGIALIFAGDLHHIALAGLVDSYKLFAPGTPVAPGDWAEMIVTTIAEAFRVGVQISAPFIVFGLVFQLGLGVLSRLIPQLQIYFIAMPATIGLGVILLMLILGTMMLWWTGQVETVFGRLLAP